MDGWDISSKNLFEAVKRSQVFEPALQEQLKPHLENLKPRAAIFNQDFIADNQVCYPLNVNSITIIIKIKQKDRADNVLTGSKLEQVETIVQDILNFKQTSKVDQVIVLWTANTERYSTILEGVNDTVKNLKTAIERDHEEISPSTLYAYAAIKAGCTYINGSPQNTFVPGLVKYAESKEVFIAGK